MVCIPEIVLRRITGDMKVIKEYLATLPQNCDNTTAVQVMTDNIAELLSYVEED